MKPLIKTLTEHQLEELHESLHYLNVQELKEVCQRYDLPERGYKGTLIHRIMTFVKTGIIEIVPLLPEVSKAQKGKKYPLSLTTLILHGSYKNDAKTRTFFKRMVGDHFHFTSFGMDWLNARWLEGKPPTYAEFIAFWKGEYKRRNKESVAPKKEWAYINFTQHYLQSHPNASRDEIVHEWEKERMHMVHKAQKLLPE